MKKIFLLALGFQLLVSAGSEEEQRKYVFEKLTPEFLQTIKDGKLKGFSLKNHSVYDYTDIYLDTDQDDLFGNKLSLRLRKRDFGNGKFQYGIQLKSEMINLGDIRMEVEEDEVDYFNIVDGNKVYKLQDVLDKAFNRLIALSGSEESIRSDVELMDAVDLLSSWITFKLGGAVEPFQKLNKIVKANKLGSLRPVMIGRSNRSRTHVYVDKNNTDEELKTLKESERSKGSTPEVLRDKNFIWTMEASLDRAKFFSLRSDIAPHVINEFEVENKYITTNKDIDLLKRFEEGLINVHRAETNLDSKYRQSVKAFQSK